MRRLGQILFKTVYGFYEDGCNPRAAALTYFTLMSIVPVVAVLLGLARGFGFALTLEDVVQDQLREQPEIAKYILDFAYKMLDQTSGGVITGVGIVLLLWSVYNILGNVEEAFNYIWKIPNPRSWVRKITDYISTIFICPLFFVISSSVTIYIKTYFNDEFRKIAFIENSLLMLLSYVATWLLFMFLYFFLPNRRIPLKYGMIAVLVAGTAYQLLQTFYISIQLKLSGYGAIYGSFAALPLFLIWLNLSWMIILFGAELAYQYEISDWETVPDRAGFEHERSTKRVLAMLIVHEVIEAFRNGESPLTIQSLSEKLGASKYDLDEVIKKLIQYKILSETAYRSDSEIHYQPARDINTINLKSVADLFPKTDEDGIILSKKPMVQNFSKSLDQYDQESFLAPSNIRL